MHGIRTLQVIGIPIGLLIISACRRFFMTSDTPNARRWLGAFLVLAAAGCIYAVRQVDPDLYGYLAYGRLHDEIGRLPTVDPFAYTSSGHRWVTFEYLAQLALWRAFDVAGPIGLIALKCLLGSATIALLWKAIRDAGSDPFVQVPLFLLATSTVSRYFLFRPQLFTFALFALFVVVLLRALSNRRAPLWVLPVAMVLWANVHGGFVAGLGAIGLALLLSLAQRLRPDSEAVDVDHHGRAGSLALTGIAALVATLINPHGVGLWRYVLTELAHDTNRRFIVEWQPASWSRDAWSATALTALSISLVLVTWYAERHRPLIARLRPWQWALSCVPLIAMAYLSVRHVPLAAIWTAPVIAVIASASGRARGARGFAVAWLAVAVTSLVSVALTIQYVIAFPRPVINTSGSVLGPTNPCGAMQFMRANAVHGNVYAPLWWGSYLTWHLYPQVLVSMDGRNISLFSDDMVAGNLRFYSATATAADLADPWRYATDFLLVPTSSDALSAVRADGRWRQIFRDRSSALFVRAGDFGARWPSVTDVGDHDPDDSDAHGCDTVLVR